MSQLDVSILLMIPDHLRKSFLAAVKLGICTAAQVSKLTGRVRAVESAHLNNLVLIGYLTKQRQGRKVVFSPQVFNKEWLSLLERIDKLTDEGQQLLAQDLMTAIHNRLPVLERHFKTSENHWGEEGRGLRQHMLRR